ncbi:putative 3-demethylubiquinone-9 3-methyltransferase (glyoxalase superfamily) [Brevundimonas alba]|uniref:Putative 3-demethylubiquinone-9 3-methyltransferase (Glyoxalase superfamily) n=1 Tax=Brevundimonas alba TaxID=74314 RepID=A0A7X5YLD6_9CAUL|nr:VOC family protein [Brevundimonas alba]NJC42090.1 putative 3-demethylubiquinone-9 3-methyltransferase (glyoxalase superfamily) [Brevundimonas alba]
MSALPPRQKVIPCLWFDKQAEEAVNFYVSLLPDSRVDAVIRSPGDYPSGKQGDVLLVEFTLAGSRYSALNGGPHFTFNEAISLQVDCEDQAEVDRLSDALSAVPEAEQCGWVKDRYGLSWQIVPYAMNRLLSDPDEGVRKRVFGAMMEMKRLNVAELERAARG